MTSINISPDDLHSAADSFSDAHKKSLGIFEDLKTTIKNIEKSWNSSTHETFFNYYKEWAEPAEGFNEILKMISQELHEMANRFESIED